MPSLTPQDISDRGDALYKSKFQALYEKQHPGKFLAIDVVTQEGFLGDSPEQALEAAQAQNINGYFHLVKIGSPGVFRVSFSRSHTHDGVIR
ncbi:MAG TPA: hypothetical protein VE263_08385 [Candidatus Angelobacter sp.]|nr:hypothetical protein [Candidatus Angelobacter sp.]